MLRIKWPILALAATVRILFLAAPPYRDELITARFLAEYAPWELVVAIPIRQPHFPLYYVVVDLLPTLQPLDGRGLSVLAGVGTVYLTMRLGERAVDNQTGVLAGALLALAPPLVVHSAWLRMYALLTCVVVASWLAVYRVLKVPSRRPWGVWCALAAVVVSLHPYGLVFAGAQALALAIATRRPWPVGAVGLLSLPYGGVLAAKVAASAGYFAPETDLGTADLVHLTTPPGLVDIYFLPGALLIGRLYLAYQWVVALVVPVVLLRGVAMNPRVRRLLVWWAVVPVVGIVLVSLTIRPVFMLKYLTPIAPVIAIAVAVWLRSLRYRPRLLLLGVMLILQLLTLGALGDTTPDIGIRVR